MKAVAALGSLPVGGAVVSFAPGTYPLLANTTYGTVTLEGSEDRPVVFRAVGAPGSAVMDGGKDLPDNSGLAAVTNKIVLPLLNT